MWEKKRTKLLRNENTVSLRRGRSIGGGRKDKEVSAGRTAASVIFGSLSQSNMRSKRGTFGSAVEEGTTW